MEEQHWFDLNTILYKVGDNDMANIHSIDSNVKFPDKGYYNMGKAGEMALYLAHCDFYPFRSVIENNKIALDVIGESYRQMAAEAKIKDNFVSEQWAMTSGTLHIRRIGKHTLSLIS